MNKNLLKIILIALSPAVCLYPASAQEDLADRLSGRILLQAEKNGEAWYVNPSDKKRYFLGRPGDAFLLMKNLGIGITDNDLLIIPVGILEKNESRTDSDQDGLEDSLENAIGTDAQKKDSDSDGFDDLKETMSGYDPLGKDKIGFDESFTLAHSGKIFIQTERNGEAWYLDPVSKKRYFLSRPEDAFIVMRSFALGISDENIALIPSYAPPAPIIEKESSLPETLSAASAMAGAADAIRKNNKSSASAFFTTEMKTAVEYTLDFLDDEGRLTLGNILSGATLSESSENKKTYSNEVYFSLGGYKVPLKFYVEKQMDGKWLLTNL